LGVAATIGQVITFYSYKGGTGRTMSLANVACLLAESLGKGDSILLVDWDLEAPGLHRFFPGRTAPSTFDTSLGLDSRQGLIDLFRELEVATPTSPPASEDDAEQRAAAALDKTGLDSFVGATEMPGIQLLRAGRDDDGRYAERVATFNWEGLFRRSPALFRALADRWSRKYRYVLVDSRTGVGDISGICTSLLPDKLVVVFTPNRQSLTGIRSLVERATQYRRQSDDLRPLTVFPLPSRIEATREDLRGKWRFGDSGNGIIGYQPMFEGILAQTYGLPECKLGLYFDSVQIQQSPDYAYGENIAVRMEKGTDRFSLSSSYRVFTDWLVNAPGPWRRQLEVDNLIDTLKERVGAESLGSEQRRGLEEIVGRLEESVKISTTASQAPSSVRLTALPNFLRFFFRPEAIEEIAEAVRAGRYVSAYTQFLIVISQSVVLPLALVYFIYRGFSDIVKALMVTYQIK
jgi:eukaryotic-like serine/threonine-protein kinase